MPSQIYGSAAVAKQRIHETIIIVILATVALASCSASFAENMAPIVPVTTAVPASSFQINIEPVITAALQCVGIALIALLSWLSVWAKQYFKNKAAGLMIDQVDDALNKSLTVGLQSADYMIRTRGWDDVAVKNHTIATAANYMIANFPDKVKAMGLDPTNAGTVTKLVDGALNRAFPNAVTVAAASPATPPTPPVTVAPAAPPAAPPASQVVAKVGLP